MCMTHEEAMTACKRGMAFLDEHKVGWEMKINLISLNVAHSHKCPLGQLYGSYEHVCELPILSGTKSRHLGFFPIEDERDYEGGCITLTHCWKMLIRKRRWGGIPKRLSSLPSRTATHCEQPPKINVM